jgi:tellurium resistance protein TerD
MAVSLDKKDVSLSQKDPGLKQALVGLGWEAHNGNAVDFDLDASVFLLKADGKVRNDNDFIFYNNPRSACGAVTHGGDNRTGVGEGDDEIVLVNLERLPEEVVKLAFTVTIHDAEKREQNFGMIHNAFIRVVNEETNSEIVRHDLTRQKSNETTMIFGELYRRKDEWRFRAVEQGFEGGLAPLAESFGVNVAKPSRGYKRIKTGAIPVSQ